MTLASVIGGAAAFLGFCIAYKWDMPIGILILTKEYLDDVYLTRK
jgi:ABC-type Mn2+/Zn2+ transport system permease subunit